MVCDGHKSGMLFSICGTSPDGTKFYFPVGVKPFGSNKTANDIFEMVKSVILFIIKKKSSKIFESFDEDSYLHRDFDFAADMSHSEKHLEMPDEMKRISGLAKLLVEKGELKLGCDFEKDILPKLSMSETFLII